LGVGDQGETRPNSLRRGTDTKKAAVSQAKGQGKSKTNRWSWKTKVKGARGGALNLLLGAEEERRSTLKKEKFAKKKREMVSKKNAPIEDKKMSNEPQPNKRPKNQGNNRRPGKSGAGKRKTTVKAVLKAGALKRRLFCKDNGEKVTEHGSRKGVKRHQIRPTATPVKAKQQNLQKGESLVTTEHGGGGSFWGGKGQVSVFAFFRGRGVPRFAFDGARATPKGVEEKKGPPKQGSMKP